MVSIQDRIAAVLADHEYWQRHNRHRDWECACGKAFGLKINLDHHVAEALAAELFPTITTTEELLRLNASVDPRGDQGPVVKDSLGDVFEANDDSTWVRLGDSTAVPHSAVQLPVRVLWTPEWDAK